MSYWRELFLSLSPVPDPVDTTRHCADQTPRVSDNVHSVGERDTYKDGDPPRSTRGSPEVIAPIAWWAGEQAVDEPPFGHPCPERRGRIIRRNSLFLHFCFACGAWGAYGCPRYRRRCGRADGRAAAACPSPRAWGGSRRAAVAGSSTLLAAPHLGGGRHAVDLWVSSPCPYDIGGRLNLKSSGGSSCRK
jgi:hypothetical protein